MYTASLHLVTPLNMSSLLITAVTLEVKSVPRSRVANTGPSLGVPLDLVIPHISYKSVLGLPLLDSFTDPAYFTKAFPTLFPYSVGGHLGNAHGNRP